MEEIIGVGLAELGALIWGGAEAGEVATSIGASVTAILETLGEDGFASLQALMHNFSNNEIYTIINTISQDAPGGAIYFNRSFQIAGMSMTELTNHINVIASKLLNKGIDIMTNNGKQIFLDIYDQIQKLMGSGIIQGVGIGTAFQSILDKYNYQNQNDNKIDYNSAVKTGTLGGAGTNNI